MRRRDFIRGIIGSVTAFPLAGEAQQGERVRRVGALINLRPDDSETQARIGAFVQGLQEAGWSIGRNLRVDYRVAPDADRLAVDLLALGPDVVLANSNPCVQQLLQATHDVPIVFVAVTDPVGSGLVQSLARPGGNATGFITAEFGMSGKWLELLKQIAPSVKRAAFLQDLTAGTSSSAQFAAIQAVAPSFGVELVSIVLHDASQLEKAIADFAHSENAGLIVSRTGASIRHYDLIINLAAQYRLPAVYPLRLFAASGGLISSGPDIVDQCRLAAGYVNRILHGEKPADLPVQAPTKYELVINLKTAKALHLTIPQTLLATADEVIE